MILPDPKDAIHKAWLYRLLIAICDNGVLANALCFKGGTCAAMLGFLDRFSVDLDFDYIGQPEDLPVIRKNFESVFKKLGLEIRDQSEHVPQYFLKYPAKFRERNTIKLDTLISPPVSNQYQSYRLKDIDRIIACQTIETMFANKLVAAIDRWEKNNSLAGRDLYDIHHFFLEGFQYRKEVIVERRKGRYRQKEENVVLVSFFSELIDFIEKRITDTVINQDLSALIIYEQFRKIRKTIKQETIIFLRDEIARLNKIFRVGQ